MATITPHQLRAGRILAGLRLVDLAEAASTSLGAVHKLETGKTQTPHAATVRLIVNALESRGVEFMSDGWVRLRSDDSKPMSVPDRVALRRAR